MNDQILLAVVDALVEDAIKKIQVPEGIPGPRGLRGKDGNSFNFEDHKEEITQLIIDNANVSLTIEQLEALQGKDGRDGKDGTSFNLDDYRDEITQLILDKIPKTFELTEEQKLELRGPTGKTGKSGPSGQDGKDGKDFSFEEHQEKITEIIESKSLKFEDLTDEQISLLTGPTGKDGKDFSIEESIELLTTAVNSAVWDIKDSLKLKFSDLTTDEVESLRGVKGQRGQDGKDFSFEESKEEILSCITESIETNKESFKLRFTDLSEEEIELLKGQPGPRGQRGKPGRDIQLEDVKPFVEEVINKVHEEAKESLKLRFSDLTAEDKQQITLRFSDLTPDNLLEIKGPRGQRGKQGTQGEDGEKGKDGLSIRGEIGPRGPVGLRGDKGFQGADGRDGKNGKDAPKITDVRVEQPTKNDLQFVFTSSDGTELKTNEVTLPKTQVLNQYVSMGGGSGSGSNSESSGVFSDIRTVTEDVLAGEAVKADSPTEVSLAFPDGLVTDATVFGFAKTDALAGSEVEVIFMGLLRDDSYMVFTLNLPLFLDVGGGITDVRPLLPDYNFMTTIGKSLGGNAIFIQIEKPRQLS